MNVRTKWLLVFILALAQVLAGLGALPFIDRDEGEYATVAMEMIRRADWVIPHVNNRAYYEKPALFFWTMAASFKVFGYSEWAARLPSALAGLALTGLMGWFARRREGDDFGLLAAGFTATSFLVVGLSRVALLDVWLTLFTTATLLFFYEGYVAVDEKAVGRWFRASWVMMGLGFLTKGPVGAIVPLGSVFFLTLVNRDILQSIRRCRPFSGLFLFLLVAGPWYLLAFLREGRNFWEGFFIAQNVGRFTDVVLGHGAPLWFYLPVLLVMVWPWFPFALPASVLAFREVRKRRKAGEKGGLDLFLLAFLGFSFVVFSLAATKQPNYVLPVVPAGILLAARWWRAYLMTGSEGRQSAASEISSAKTEPMDPESVSDRFPRWTFGLTALVGLVLGGALVAVPFILPQALARAKAEMNTNSYEYAYQDHAPDVVPGTPLLGLGLAAGGLAAFFLARKKTRNAALGALVSAAVLFSGGLFHVAAPPFMNYLQTPARDMAYEVRSAMGPDDRLATYGLYKPTLWFYTQRFIDRIKTDEPEKLAQYLAGPGPRYLMTRTILLDELKAQPGFRLLGVRGGYAWGVAGTDGLNPKTVPAPESGPAPARPPASTPAPQPAPGGGG
jgi:4-amino-4-deoxy-L-arabinose transferase-like glycosyltransferase